MPFSTLVDPIEVARAHAALGRAWAEIQARPELLLGTEAAERLRLAIIIAGLVPLAIDEDDLVIRSLQHFSAQPSRNQRRAAAS